MPEDEQGIPAEARNFVAPDSTVENTPRTPEQTRDLADKLAAIRKLEDELKELKDQASEYSNRAFGAQEHFHPQLGERDMAELKSSRPANERLAEDFRERAAAKNLEITRAIDEFERAGGKNIAGQLSY